MRQEKCDVTDYTDSRLTEQVNIMLDNEKKESCVLRWNCARVISVTVSGRELTVWRDQPTEQGHYPQTFNHDDL